MSTCSGKWSPSPNGVFSYFLQFPSPSTFPFYLVSVLDTFRVFSILHRSGVCSLSNWSPFCTGWERSVSFIYVSRSWTSANGFLPFKDLDELTSQHSESSYGNKLHIQDSPNLLPLALTGVVRWVKTMATMFWSILNFHFDPFWQLAKSGPTGYLKFE